MNKVEIYTDGACSGNPGPGGWAYIILVNGKEYAKNCGAEKNTTNNRMEITAVLKALEELDIKDQNLTIYSDSAYVVNTISKGWLDKWVKYKLDKLNMDLWIKIYNLWKPDYQIKKVLGHSNNKYNNECDQLAVQARMSIV